MNIDIGTRSLGHNFRNKQKNMSRRDLVLRRDDHGALMRMDVFRVVVINSVLSQTKTSGLRRCLSTADDAITISGSY